MTRYKQRNFYINTLATNLEELYSYSTLVGYRYQDKVFFTKQKYSPTTSKQCTQYTREQGLKRYDISQKLLRQISEATFTLNKIDILNMIKMGVYY